MDNNDKKVKRRWWIAGLLSYLLPGLGQVYNGQATKGLLFNFVFSLWGGIVFSIIFHTMKGSITQLNVVFLALVLMVSFVIHLFIIIEGIRTANKVKESYQLKFYNKLYVYILAILITLGVDYSLASATREFVVQAYKIPAASMQPTLLVGDYLISNQLYFRTRNPARGDLVIFKYPKNERLNYIKRIVGVPGDTLEIIEKKVYINHAALDESYIQQNNIQVSLSGPNDNLNPIVIPQNEYFVMGDNRDNSEDSRHWGTVKRHQIIGKPIIVYWSWDGRISSWSLFRKIFSIRPGRIGKILE